MFNNIFIEKGAINKVNVNKELHTKWNQNNEKRKTLSEKRNIL